MDGLLLTRTDVVMRGALDGLAARHRAFADGTWSGDFSDAKLIRKFGDVPDDLSTL